MQNVLYGTKPVKTEHLYIAQHGQIPTQFNKKSILCSCKGKIQKRIKFYSSKYGDTNEAGDG